MFDGVIAQLKPWAHHCNTQFERLMSRLEAIQTTIADTSQDPLDRRSFPRASGSGNFTGSDPLFTVPLGQVWILESVLLNCATGAGARVVLSQQPNMVLPIFAGQLDNAGSFGARGATWSPNTVILPQTPVYLTVTDNVGNPFDVYVQCRQVDIPSRPEPSGLYPRRAHTGPGKPEGMTSAQGPPTHELGRDAQSLPTLSR